MQTNVIFSKKIYIIYEKFYDLLIIGVTEPVNKLKKLTDFFNVLS